MSAQPDFTIVEVGPRDGADADASDADAGASARLDLEPDNETHAKDHT